jgi:ubiquinone/menaquinone biosynthesis C-methylase UbiE
MERVEAMGVYYPAGHKDLVAGMYSLDNVPYPYIIRQIGEARIRKHFLYMDLFRSMGYLLDYGCGTGDAIRQLIRDGYMAGKITGFDVNDASLRIGYDLYLDREQIAPLVTVAPSFPCPPERFDRVYSGSVIHVLGSEQDFSEYLEKAYRTLKPGGTFFGSTLGLEDSAMQRPKQGPPRLMRKIELLEAMDRAGFSGVRLQDEEHHVLSERVRGFCLIQFAADKPVSL